MFILVLTFSC